MIVSASRYNGQQTVLEFYSGVFKPLKTLGLKRGTIVQYNTCVNHWSRFAGDTPIAEVDDLLVAEFAGWILSFDVAPTVNKNLRHLRPILKLAHKKNVLSEVPEITMLPEDIEPPRAFLLEEIERMLAAAKSLPGCIAEVPAGDWWEAIILALYDSGGRIGAVLATKAGNVDLTEGWMLLSGASQKRGRGQMLRLHSSTIPATLRVLSPAAEHMWPWPWGREALYKHFRRILVKADVETWKGTGSLFHRIRKSCASYAAAAGLDPVFQMGHSSPAVTARYLDERIIGRTHAADVLPRPKF